MSGPDDFLPYGRQDIGEDDIAAVADALRSSFLTTGPLVETFEAACAEASGAAHVVVCNSGTSALHLATLALELRPEDAVIVPAITFVATANVVRMTGAEVVFCDVDPDTGLMTAETLAAAEQRARRDGRRVKAVYPVHLNGQLCDMPALRAAARDLAIVEDACHCLGVPRIGANDHSDIACFSTHPVKAIATGEGGFATTRDPELARRMRLARSHGITRAATDFVDRELAFDRNEVNGWYYEMDEIGWNYRMPDILCALGISQLKKLDRFMARRREIAALYDELLAPCAPLLRPVPHGHAPHGWHLYVVLIDFARLGRSRRQVMSELFAQKIGTQVHYIPVPRQPYYRKRYGHIDLPGAARYYERCLSIPFFPRMADDQVRRVAGALARIAGGPG